MKVIKSSSALSRGASLTCLLAAFGWTSAANAVAASSGEGHSHQHHAQHLAVADSAASGAAAHDHGTHGGMGADADPHAHHRAMMAQRGYQRSEHVYPLSDYRLADMSGEATSLQHELDTDRPVMVNFIFTTCTTICPLMSGIFAQVQQQLGPESEAVRMISISIDPEYDTPERLREYAQRFGAGPQWQFLTGDSDDIVSVQKAFDVYRGNKMSHEPATFLRRSAKDPWVRLDGMASAAEVVAEYHSLIER